MQLQKPVAILTLLSVLVMPSLVFASENATVLDVIDGDTLRIQIEGKTEKVRIIGIDTPETVDPRKPVQCFGKEASARLKELLTGKAIELENNPAEDRDVYDRLLRYVELEGEDIGATMIREGYAHSYRKYPHPRLETYNDLEAEARTANRGLWADCSTNESAALFTDVVQTHPYIDAIQWGKTTNVLSGYPDGTFQPDKSVNRAELLKIILAAKGIDVASSNSQSGFSDVDESAWYAPYIRYAKEQGVVQGYPDGSFRPNQTVNFAEALKMAYLIFNIDTPAANGEWYAPFLNHARTNSVLFSSSADVASGMARKDVVWIAFKLTTLPQTPTIVPDTTPREEPEQIQEEPSECSIKGNISSKKERIYHVEGCGSYSQTVIDTSKGERMFCSEKEAVAAGWRKALNCP